MSHASGYLPATHQLSTFESVCQTIVRLPVPGAHRGSVSADSTPTLVAMEQLVSVVSSLHQTVQQHGTELSDYHSDLAWTIDHLLPYVSEEADDVLDALQETGEWGNVEALGELERIRKTELISISNLVPRLLWSVMRSSYPVMRLLEGLEVQHYQTDRGWKRGMLRLVSLLDLQLPELSCCFDLATSQPLENLLEPNSLLQTEEPILPLPRSPLAFVVGMASHQTISAGEQLQALRLQVQGADPVLEKLLEGVSVECLHPGQGWQMGQLQLKLGFEFAAQTSPAIALSVEAPTDLVEAELIEDTKLTVPPLGNVKEVNPITHVAVIELPRQSLGTAQVRLKQTIDWATQFQIHSYHWLETTARLHQISPLRDRDLYQIVKIACGTADALQQSFRASTLPMRLMDDLLPKLLWQISRSSYEVMQLVGGLAVQVLQPDREWQQGILRLLPNLHIKTAIADYQLDLITGQPIRSELAILPISTICQQILGLSMEIHPQINSWAQNPIQIQDLLSQLQHQLQQTFPEIISLQQGIEIDWLEPNQDWRSAELILAFDFAFISERTYDDEGRHW